MQREKWIARNISNGSLSMGFTEVQALKTRDQVDLLLYVSKETVAKSTALKRYIEVGSIEVDKYKDNILTATVNASNVSTALSLEEINTDESPDGGLGLLTAEEMILKNGNFSTPGDAQKMDFILRNITTNNTPTELFLDGSSLRMPMAENSTWSFRINISARRTDSTGESAGYTAVGVVDKGATAGSIGLVDGPMITSVEDVVEWNASIEADTSNGTLVIKVTGENAKTIRWVGWVEIVQVKQ